MVAKDRKLLQKGADHSGLHSRIQVEWLALLGGSRLGGSRHQGLHAGAGICAMIRRVRRGGSIDLYMGTFSLFVRESHGKSLILMKAHLTVFRSKRTSGPDD